MRGGWIGGGVLALGLAGCGASGGLEGLGGASPNARSIIVEADFHTLRTPPRPEGAFDLLTLSTLPDAVTGGDVLMAVRGLTAADRLSVAVDGVDQTAAFSRREDGEWRGRVSGLRLGANTVTATAEGPAGRRQASLTVVNHPITGPVISGPHQQPFRCRTEEAGLGAPVDEFCSAPTQFTWYYRSLLTQSFRVLEDPFSPYPADVMTTRTRDGRAVPFVVRVEAATINRSITRIAVLANRPDWGGDHAAAVAASRPPLFGDRCAFGTVGGRLDLPNALLAPLGIAQLPLLPGLPADIDVSVPLRVDVPEDFDSGLGVCSLTLPVTSTPRGVAGMPATDDVLACQLKPIDPADYAGRLSAAQLAELATIFPEGVCDYSKPSRGFTEKSLIWPSVGSGPVAQEPFELRWRVARALP